MSSSPPSSSRSVVFPVVVALLFVSALESASLPAAPVRAAVTAAAAGPGDILRIWDHRSVVYVVTNDDPALADALLDGVTLKERRVLSLDAWQKLPEGTRWYFSSVFLINRERLRAGERLPDSAAAPVVDDELWTQVVRSGRTWGVAHDVTISAPDAAWLRHGVHEFRRLAGVPRGPLRRNVRSVAVIPVGGGSAMLAAENYVAAANAAASAAALAQATAAETARRDRKPGPTVPPRLPLLVPHLLAPDRYAEAQNGGRLAASDEIVLVDRSSAGASGAAQALPVSLADALRLRRVGGGETVIWREPKTNGRARVIVSAPAAEQLAEALRRLPRNPMMAVSETPVVLASARDLRAVRRVAVAGIKTAGGDDNDRNDLVKRLAGVAAREVRALDAFEVLERAGLSALLAEIALDQAGITRAGDRAKVRQLAAADALLLVEITDARAGATYTQKQERLTPPLGRAPRRPLEPSRLKYAVNLPGKENDPITRALADSLLKSVVGTKTDREYKAALNAYYSETLPRWQQDLDEYNLRYKRRQISWRQTVLARRTASVSGSLRLVDLIDGLVLWEAPFSARENEDGTYSVRTVSSVGEDSQPRSPRTPPFDLGSDGIGSAADDEGDSNSDNDEGLKALLARTGEAALREGVGALRGTALLPFAGAAGISVAAAGSASSGGAETALGPSISVPLPAASAAAPQAAIRGRILDLEGDTLLVGLGAGDGVALGDALLVRSSDGDNAAPAVRLVVTRVRPRTCDAVFEKSAPGAGRARVTIGHLVTPAPAPEAGATKDEPVKP